MGLPGKGKRVRVIRPPRPEALPIEPVKEPIEVPKEPVKVPA